MIRPADAGRIIQLGDQIARVLSSGTPGHDVAVVDTLLPPGASAPRHVHHDHEEAFYVVEGRMHLQLDDEVSESGPGGFVLAQRGQVHAFSNPGPGDARVLAMYSPASALAYLDDLAAVLAAGADPDEMAAFYRRHGSASA